MDYEIAYQNYDYQHAFAKYGYWYNVADALRYATPSWQQQMIQTMKLTMSSGSYSASGQQQYINEKRNGVSTIESVAIPSNAPNTATTAYALVTFSSVIYGTNYPQAGESLGTQTKTLELQKVNGAWLVSKAFAATFN